MIEGVNKQAVLVWMQKYCMGFQQARKKADILPFILFQFNHKETKDRRFREIIHELHKEGHVYSSSDRGYWAVPLVTQDIDEINEMIKALREEKGRALAIIDGVDKRIKELSGRVNQPELREIREGVISGLD